MKLNLCAILTHLSLVSSVVVATSKQDYDAWLEYKANFEKEYSSPEEEQYRMNIFIDNKHYIESHNTKSQLSFTQGVNPLSDLTPQEVVDSRSGFRLGAQVNRSSEEGLLEALLVAVNSSASVNVSGPVSDLQGRSWFDSVITKPSIDWRSTGRVSRVKDQGSCGSCWSFATTGALEAITALRNKSTLLSEQNLIDCSSLYGNNGCEGGLMDSALRYVRDFGIMASRDYRYTGKKARCKFVREKSVMRVRGSVVLPRGNEALLRLALALTGPLPVAIDAGARSFHSYKSGIYDEPSCKNKGSSLNHAVLLVGYGTDNGTGDYWILKNSWGKKWGDQGYMKIARNRDNLCGVATYAVLPIQ